MSGTSFASKTLHVTENSQVTAAVNRMPATRLHTQAVPGAYSTPLCVCVRHNNMPITLFAQNKITMLTLTLDAKTHHLIEVERLV